jgi:hypothetical protein
LIILIIFGEVYKLLSISLCSLLRPEVSKNLFYFIQELLPNFHATYSYKTIDTLKYNMTPTELLNVIFLMWRNCRTNIPS